MPLGLYISVPFCRSKCSYCNFASGVFSRELFTRYVHRLVSDIARASQTATGMGAEFDRTVDSIYLGGGTPTVLDPVDLDRIFAAVREHFTICDNAEVTVECAPGSLAPPMLECLVRNGATRVSLGVQSFVDEEARAVARLHTRQTVLDDVARLRAAGITNINIDLIAGLPHQTPESWQRSLDDAIATAPPHVSVYMLEVDEDSRLGRELIAGGTRYHAHFVPDDDITVDLYSHACEVLDRAGIRQYEISNFAREDCASRHNLKYWTRQPYLGFGVDAHSMLWASSDPYVLLRADHEAADPSRPCAVTAADIDAIRFATPDSLDDYLAGAPFTRTPVSRRAALEEEFFLGLRLVRGIDLAQIGERYCLNNDLLATINALTELGLLQQQGSTIRLTHRGRLLSNEVFQRFLTAENASTC
jgi:oxygen-independent coproporphyrinogen-3 oxidase